MTVAELVRHNFDEIFIDALVQQIIPQLLLKIRCRFVLQNRQHGFELQPLRMDPHHQVQKIDRVGAKLFHIHISAHPMTLHRLEFLLLLGHAQ